MSRRRGRFLPLVVAVVVVLLIAQRRSSSNGGGDATPADTSESGRYRPRVQEGLGASVAILLDQSGSMDDTPDDGGTEPKYLIARRALAQVLAQTDSFVARQPGFPVNVGLYVFSSRVRQVLPIAPFRHDVMDSALAALPAPSGNTAIGAAMLRATADLYGAGTIRKYLLVVTDGANTTGPEPDAVAREIAQRSEGAVQLYLVAFDVDAGTFAFVNDVRGTVLEARNATALRAGLDTLYRGRILAEAMDAGETLPAAGASGAPSLPPTPPR